MTRRWTVTLLPLILLAAASCAMPGGEPGALTDIAPGERPALDSDEAGLWMAVDRIENNLKTSGHIVRDPELNAYVRDIVCRLATDYCEDLRIYIVQVPHFNAAMYPSGMLQVWTGLLLRAENEAQLAYVLGHEIGHYLRRHSIQQWRDVRGIADALVFVQIAAAAAGQGYLGYVAQLAALGSIFAFSREQEREADQIGFELMARAGYDASQAGRIWEALIEEKEAADDPEQFIFFSTHPSSEERMETLDRLAGEYSGQAGLMETNQGAFIDATRSFRTAWLRDEVRKRDHGGFQVVLDNLIEAGEGVGVLHFFWGEMHRLRGDDGDESEAVAAYRRALEAGGAPAETHRSLGLLMWKAGELGEARRAFEDYLAAAPEAEDRAMIDSYLHRIEGDQR
jgi:predicted Zn-dependent protease